MPPPRTCKRYLTKQAALHESDDKRCSWRRLQSGMTVEPYENCSRIAYEPVQPSSTKPADQG